MKKLTLFRHAKSSWKFPVNDRQRPLNARGLAQVNVMAKTCQLALPDLIISSPAVRALSSAMIYVEHLGILPSSLVIEELLYFGHISDLMSWVSNFDDHIIDVWMFGHSPTLNHLAEKLLEESIDDLVTSAYVSMSIDTETWSEATTSKTELLELNQRQFCR